MFRFDNIWFKFCSYTKLLCLMFDEGKVSVQQELTFYHSTFAYSLNLLLLQLLLLLAAKPMLGGCFY